MSVICIERIADPPLRRQVNGVVSNGAIGDGEENVEEGVAGGDGKLLRTGYAVVDLEEDGLTRRGYHCCESSAGEGCVATYEWES